MYFVLWLWEWAKMMYIKFLAWHMARAKDIVTCIIYYDFDINTEGVARHKAAQKGSF